MLVLAAGVLIVPAINFIAIKHCHWQLTGQELDQVNSIELGHELSSVDQLNSIAWRLHTRLAGWYGPWSDWALNIFTTFIAQQNV